MQRAVEQMEVDKMPNEVSRDLQNLRAFYEIQKALDKITDPASRTILEEQKKELIERIDNHR